MKLLPLLVAQILCLSAAELEEDDARFFRKLATFREGLADGKFNDAKLGFTAEIVDPKWAPSNRITWNALTCDQADIDFKIEKLIYGSKKDDKNKVFRARDTSSGKLYAYKTFGNSNDFANELAFYMQAGDHPNLLKAHCVQRPRNQRERAGLLMDWFDGISSPDYAAKDSVSHRGIKRVTHQILNTLTYVHQLGFLHGDLKADNVMVDPNSGLVKVFDWGFTAPVNNLKLFRGNPRIVAPEMAGIGPCEPSFGSDMWAFGSIVGTLHAQKFPEIIGRKDKIYAALMIGKNGEFFEFGKSPVGHLPQDVLQIMYICLHPNPSFRSFGKPENLRRSLALDYFKI